MGRNNAAIRRDIQAEDSAHNPSWGEITASARIKHASCKSLITPHGEK
ncbi:Uncharacterized protein dnm_042630 [Desulfonema magnum]|uniref:Uncharacterized protein n=1 Tax=Desulfonema magnum TaxID=45655 RepID=A0A975BMJ4_9BACT|nr:Uncharacterized protein dnm_042630 [Desulfonema magnum]